MVDHGIRFQEDETFKPGRYADDIPVIVLFLSLILVFVGMLAFAIDGWQSGSYFMLQAIYCVLLYAHLEKRP